MERRKFMIGVGSLAAGSAAAMGTGAFTSVSANRNVDVNVATDANAYLRLEGAGGANSEYVTQDGSNGTLTINLDENVNGDGVNPNAVTEIDHLFLIQNQGTQEVDVSISKSSADGNEGAVSFHSSGDTDSDASYTSSNRIDGNGNNVTLTTGESVYVSLKIDTTNWEQGDGDSLLDSVTINATA